MRDDLVARATDYAQQAKDLALAKEMKGNVKKADKLLAQIAECSP